MMTMMKAPKKGLTLCRVIKRVSCSIDKQALYHYRRGSHSYLLDFIKLHGFAAHVQRRAGTSSKCGVRLKDI